MVGDLHEGADGHEPPVRESRVQYVAHAQEAGPHSSAAFEKADFMSLVSMIAFLTLLTSLRIALAKVYNLSESQVR